jgi:hypothetical protein
MSKKLLLEMNRLVERYGEPLSNDSDPYKYAFYHDEADSAGNELRNDLVIGKTATGAYILGKAAVTVQVSMLNESFGIMPEDDAGHLVGEVDITANRYKHESENVITVWTPIGISFYMFASGRARLVYAETFKAEPNEKKLYKLTGADGFSHKETTNGLTLVDEGDRYLDGTQVSKLHNFVVGAFVDLAE